MTMVEAAEDNRAPSTPKRSLPSTPCRHPKSPGRYPGSHRETVCIPDRRSSLNAASPRNAAPQISQPLKQQVPSLVHGYMVCGLGRDPTEWTISPQGSSGKAQRTQGSMAIFIQPSILGSIPPHDQDSSTAQMFASAIKAAFPNDAEIHASDKAPDSTCHAFVLQSSSSQSLYGVALRLWVRVDAKRRAKILEVLATKDSGASSIDKPTWMPYCFTYISHYPIFDLMSDYLRCSWLLYGKEPDRFNSEGVLRLTRTPPPKPEQFVRIALDEYTFCYKMPGDPARFQNFSLWPTFTCLSVQQFIAILEAALSPQGKIVFTSHHPAILTTAAETVRHYVKTWAGLYVPVAYSRYAQDQMDEPAPYILGITKQSRSLLNVPRDALLIDLDHQRIFTSRPPGSLSPRQRKKYAGKLSQVLREVTVNGVPDHLRSAFDQNAQFKAAGTIIALGKSASAVKDPEWWDPVQVAAVMDRICKRIRRNYKLLAALNSVKQQSVKVSAQDLTSIIHTRNFLSRSVDEAWQAYIKFKRRSDAKVLDLLNRETNREAEMQKQKEEYTELSECTEQLIEETRLLQVKVNKQMKDTVQVSSQLRDKTIHAKQLANHISELQSELGDANETLAVQRELLSEIERSRDDKRASTLELENECVLISQERDEAHRAVIHLTSLISGQITYIERVISSLIAAPSRPTSAQDIRNAKRRSFQSQSSNSPQPSPALSQFPLLKPVHERSTETRRHTVDFSQSVLAPLSAAIAAHAAPGRSMSPLSQELLDEESGEPTFREKVGAVAETVRKINEQCRAAIQDLADKRIVIDSRDSPASPSPQRTPTMKSANLAKPEPKSSPPPLVQSAISRLIQASRGEQLTSDTSSRVSGGTVITMASSMRSSTPSLDSLAPTILSENPTEAVTNKASLDGINIRTIDEQEEEDSQHLVDAEPVQTKVKRHNVSGPVDGTN